MSWNQFQTALTAEQSKALLDQATHSLSSLPLATLRNRQALAQAAEQALSGALRRLNLPQPDGSQWASLVAQVVARIGGLGFLDALLPPASFAYTDLLVNGNGSVWGRRKGAMAFEQLDAVAQPRGGLARRGGAALAPGPRLYRGYAVRRRQVAA